jgi:tetratricopeptide (TPR) repeat protein
MPARIFICIIFLSVSLHIPAQKFITFQTWDTDSLLSVLPGQLAEERVLTLNRLVASLFFRDCPRSLKYADSAMALAKHLNYEEGLAGAFRNFGHIYFYLGNYPESLNSYFEALSVYERMGRLHDLMMSYYEIAKTHFMAGNYQATLRYGFRAMELCRRPLKEGGTVGGVRDSITFDGGMGQTYGRLDMNAEALKYNLEALELLNRHHYPAIERLIFTWVLGITYMATGKYDSAKMYLYKALAFPDENINIIAQKFRAGIWLAIFYSRTGETDSALFYGRGSFEWYNDNGLFFWAMTASNFLGWLHYRINDLDHAEKWILESERLFSEILARDSWYRDDSLKSISAFGYELYYPLPLSDMKYMTWDEGENLYHALFRIYEKKKNTSKALRYHILYANAGDSLQKLRKQRETMEMQVRYESEQKEKQIEFLSAENEMKAFKLRQSRILLFGLAGFAVLIVLLAVVLVRQFRLKERQNSLVLQQKLFRSQMNPHFIFNSLSGIHHFILHEQPSKAASYLSRFSKLIRSILHSSVEEYISLDDEKTTIENYLELQKIRFPDKFDFTVEMDEMLDAGNISIPCMITQPFVENAIEHGIKDNSGRGFVSVRFMRKNWMVRIEVEDNGIGRAKARELALKEEKVHQSLSTSIIRERIRALNKTLKKKITLDIVDLVNEKGKPSGTKVILEVPLQ